MAKYLRRRKDGMIFGWNPQMAEHPDVEVVEGDIESLRSERPFGDKGPKGMSEQELFAHHHGLREGDLAGYPDRGKATNPLAPYGTNPPDEEELAAGKFGPTAQKVAVERKQARRAAVKEAAKTLEPTPVEAGEEKQEIPTDFKSIFDEAGPEYTETGNQPSGGGIPTPHDPNAPIPAEGEPQPPTPEEEAADYDASMDQNGKRSRRHR